MQLSPLAICKRILLVVLIVAGIVGVYLGYKRLPQLVSEFYRPAPRETMPGKEIVITIPKGATLSQVGKILQDNGIIRSSLVLKLVAFIRGEQRKVKAGDYLLKTSSDPGDVLDLLISGKTLVITLTVPEGYNIFQIADLFQQTGISTREEILSAARDKAFVNELGVEGSSLEGYLFPDTYFVRPSERGDPKLVLRRMVQRFREVYDKQVKATAEQFGWTPLQVVTLASLIEKEAKASEHALVSAVFHNRLRSNMKLQSDPTVIYGIKPMGSKITRADLERKHPYNTYQILGLPPGPIANPGRESLVAAVAPADVDYLYFVSKNDGTHQFSNTLQEHNRWVNLYQKQPVNQVQ